MWQRKTGKQNIAKVREMGGFPGEDFQNCG
jgi:hypothetical protein